MSARYLLTSDFIMNECEVNSKVCGGEFIHM